MRKSSFKTQFITFMAWAFFYLGLSLAFMKTAEALTRFGPRSFMGYDDPSIPVYWGLVAALMVEGVVAYSVSILINRWGGDVEGVEWTSWFVLGGSFILSLLFNFVDTGMNEGWLDIQVASPMMNIFRFVTSSLPIIMAFVFSILLIMDGRLQGMDNKSHGQGQGQNKGGGDRQREIERMLSGQRPGSGGGGGGNRIPQAQAQVRVVEPTRTAAEVLSELRSGNGQKPHAGDIFDQEVPAAGPLSKIRPE